MEIQPQQPKAKTKAEPKPATKREVESPQMMVAKPTPSGRIVEVVIPRSQHSSVKSRQSSSPSSADDKDSDSEEIGKKRKRRAAIKTVVIISDDEQDSASEVPTKKAIRSRGLKASTAAATKKRKIAKRDSSPSSDYQGSSSEDETSDAESEFDEEEDIPKSKSKAKGKTKAVPKAKSTGRSKASIIVDDSEETSNDDDMDVDEPETKPVKKAAKRKAADNAERPAKKPKRADSDPWKLGSRAVQGEWTFMQAPPFEMFHFARVVVDEYTYLDGKVHSLVTNLTAERKWVLSGTPPIHDFGALKTISAFLDIHLGVDDDGEGQSAEVKKRRREQTGMHAIY